MAYLVLARKYRPERFSEVVGQDHITRTLTNAIEHDRVHHAYMFCGVRGLGKTTVARILAKCLVCERGPTAEPCNVCEQCLGVKEGRSTDVIEIDAASNNGVENIRRLREQVHYLPQSARRKVYIIDEVHMLSNAAFNALLKTLEEPPPHVTFFFATTDPQKVLPTIMSRVNRLDFRRVAAEPMIGHLRDVLQHEGLGAEDEALHMISRASEGSVRDALTYLDEIIAFAEDPSKIRSEEARMILGQADRFAVGELVAAILACDAANTLARFDDIARTTGNLEEVAIGVLQHFRDLAVVKATSSPAGLLDVSASVFDQLQAQANGLDHTRIAQLFDRFARTVEGLDKSASPRLVLEMGLLDLAHATPVQPIGALVDRLTALANGQAPHGGGGRGGGGGGRGGGGRPQRDSAPRSASDPGSRPPAAMRTETRTAPNTSPTPRPRAAPEPSVAPSMSAPPSAAPPAPAPRATVQPTAAPRAAAQPAGSPAASAPGPSLRPNPTTPAPEPSVNAAPAAPARPGSLSDQLWSMLPGGASPGGSVAHAATPAPTLEPERRPPPTAAPSEPPRPRGPGFELAAQSERDQPPRPSERVAVVDPQAGCPSSRCEPRAAIPWRELEPFAAWEALLDRIRDEDELLFAVLGELGLSKLHDSGIELAAARGSFAREQLQSDAEIRARIEAYVRDSYGEPLPIRFTDAVPSLPELPSYKLIELDRIDRHRQHMEHRARANPKIRALVEEFGGQISHIEALGEPPRE